MKLFRVLLLMLAAVTAVAGPVKAATTLLPNGQQCFVGDGGQPLVNGSINMFVPPGTTVKTTWQNANQTVANTNPIALDANGCAIIYGVGSYRQQVFDGPVVGGVTTGNLIFDLTTTDTSAYNSVFWASLASGTPNVITIVDTGFNATDGTVINFLALATNTGATTLNPSGYGAINIEKATTAGLVSLTGGEIVANNPISVIYSSTDNAFILLNPPIQSASGAALPLCGAIGTKINVTSNTAVSLSATTLTTTASTGTVINRNSLAVSINASTVGANGLSTDVSGGALAVSTWYYIWAIDNGSAAAGLISVSSSAPILPSSYTTQCRLGAIITDGSTNIERTLQLGRYAQYVVGTNPAVSIKAASGTAGTGTAASPTLAAVSLAGFVPPTATAVDLSLDNQYTGATTAIVFAAPNANWGGANNGPTGSSGNMYPLYSSNSNGQTATAKIVLESTSVYWWSGAAGGGLGVLGWDDNTNAN
jgi:hypothetical protein